MINAEIRVFLDLANRCAPSTDKVVVTSHASRYLSLRPPHPIYAEGVKFQSPASRSARREHRRPPSPNPEGVSQNATTRTSRYPIFEASHTSTPKALNSKARRRAAHAGNIAPQPSNPEGVSQNATSHASRYPIFEAPHHIYAEGVTFQSPASRSARREHRRPPSPNPEGVSQNATTRTSRYPIIEASHHIYAEGVKFQSPASRSARRERRRPAPQTPKGFHKT